MPGNNCTRTRYLDQEHSRKCNTLVESNSTRMIFELWETIFELKVWILMTSIGCEKTLGARRCEFYHCLWFGILSPRTNTTFTGCHCQVMPVELCSSNSTKLDSPNGGQSIFAAWWY